MFTALNENNSIVLARTSMEQGLYYCRSCGNRVCAKIGTGSRTPHFSHIHAPCGDTWADYKTANSMSQWHIGHQSMYPKEAREVTLYQSGDWYRNGADSLPVRHTEKPGDLPDGVEYHRADIYMNGLVVEYQISRLPFDEIIKRERFYVNMVWVVESNRYYTDSHWYRSNKPVWVNDGDYMIPSIKDGINARLTILEFVDCVKDNTLPNRITHPMQKGIFHSKTTQTLPTTTYTYTNCRRARKCSPQKFTVDNAVSLLGEIECFFETSELPLRPISITKCETILDVNLYVNTNISIAKRLIESPSCEPYIFRLQQLKEYLQS